MSLLTDYLNLETIQQLQDAFAAAANADVRICGPDGRRLVPDHGTAPEMNAVLRTPAAQSADPFDVPVVVNGQLAGRIKLEDHPHGDPVLLRLLGNMLGHMCEREIELRTRIEQLATLYKLTAEFTDKRDLQEILDTTTRTVVEVMGVKACVIRMLSKDNSELVIRSVAGLSKEYLDKGPILLDDNEIDRQLLASGETVAIADMRTDPRVVYSSQARNEGIVSALCVPMKYKGGNEGILRVYTAQPHEFDWFEVSLIQSIAAQAAAAIVNARLYEEAIRSAEVRRQLNMAATVQRRMIPAEPPVVPGFDIGAVYVPSLELSGDFYDFIPLPKNNLGIGICDVSGKGVRASLLMASIRASLRAHSDYVYHMTEVIERVNVDLCADTLVSDFATLFYAVLDVSVRRVTYSNAGHAPPIYVSNGKMTELSTGGMVIGMDPTARYEHEWFTMNSGDIIFAYTDGLSEALNFDDEPFGIARIRSALKEAISQGLSADGICKHILWQLRKFTGLQKRADDLTLLTIKAL